MRGVLKHGWIRGLILLVTLFALGQDSLATTVRIPSDVDMVVGARAIVRGKVLSVGSAISEQDNRIYTYITVRVNEVLKGQITTRRIVLKELGGVVGERITVVYGAPRFTRGEKVLLYLDTRNDGSLKTHQMFLGKFNITIDSSTGQEFAVRSTADENTTVLPAEAPGHPSRGDSTERLELSAYTELVRQNLTANLEQARSFEETYYQDIPTLAKPGEYSRSGFEDAIQPQFVLLNPTGRWRESDTGQSIPYTLNTTPIAGVPVLPVAPSDIAAAASSWSNVSGSGLRITSAGSMSQCYSGSGLTGIHVVSNNCDGQNTPSPGCAGVLAWGGWSGGQFSPQVVNGVTFQYRLTQGFVSCNPWAACTFGDHCSVQFIVTHELGHALGFGHSAIPQATMYAFAQAIARCAVLHVDDENAARAVYPGTGGGGPLSITTASPLANGTIGTAYSQTLLATGGTSPYTWSLVSVAGQSLPPGLALGATGTISGNPTTAGTYNFTVQARDSAASPATVQKAFAITTGTASIPYNSQFLSQTVPTTLTPGQEFSVSMRWRNTGTQTWSGPNFYFVTQNPPFNTTWGGPGAFNAVSLINFVIGPGQDLDATFTMVAPTTPGTYNFQWQIFQDFGVEFFGQMSTNVAIAVGVPPPPPYQGFLDAAGCGIITGWAWDPTQPNSTTNVEIYDGTTLVTTLAANLFREDIVNAGIGNGFHGFSFTVPTGLKNGTTHDIRVVFSGSSSELGNSPRVINCTGATPVYQGYHDGAGCNTISGWAWDANDPNNPVNVDIYDGTTLIAIVPAIQFRPDLVTAGIGNGFHGFSYTVPASLKDGQQHSIRIRFPGSATSLGNTPRNIQCNGAAPVFEGTHEVANCSVISGWAWDRNDPNSPINVAIFDGTQLVATVLAIQFRQDLVTSGIGNGYHAFTFNVPANLKNSQAHSIRVRYSGVSTSLGSTPRSITCASP